MTDAEELQLLLHMSEGHTSGYSHAGITAPAVNTSSDVSLHVSRQTRVQAVSYGGFAGG
jgi:hypothetical protein